MHRRLPLVRACGYFPFNLLFVSTIGREFHLSLFINTFARLNRCSSEKNGHLLFTILLNIKKYLRLTDKNIYIHFIIIY